MSLKLYGALRFHNGIIPHTNKRYRIDARGGIEDLTLGFMVQQHKYNNEFFADIHLIINGNSILTRVRTAMLMAATYKCSSIPVELWSEVEFFYKDGKTFNLRASNLAYKPFDDKFDVSHNNDTYRLIPFATRFAVNRTGEVIEVTNRQVATMTVSPAGHLVIIRPDTSPKTKAMVSRVLALAYLPYCSDVDKLTAALKEPHLTDLKLENLEWRRRDKHIHITSARPVKVKDVLTGKITHYNTSKEAADDLGVNCRYLYASLEDFAGQIRRPHHIYIDALDSFPPVNVTDEIKLQLGLEID